MDARLRGVLSREAKRAVSHGVSQVGVFIDRVTRMCTRVMWSDTGDKTGNAVLVGGNMDFHRDLLTNLGSSLAASNSNDVPSRASSPGPRGNTAAWWRRPSTSHRWTGSTRPAWQEHPVARRESTYSEPDDAQVQLQPRPSGCSTSGQFRHRGGASRGSPRPTCRWCGWTIPRAACGRGLHLALIDATGDSAIIEYVDRHARVYRSRRTTR